MNIQFKKLTQKRLIFNKMNIIEKLQQNTSFRPNGAPFILNFNQYNYKYVKYLKKHNISNMFARMVIIGIKKSKKGVLHIF